MTSSTADRLESLDGESAQKGVAVVTGGSAGLGRATVRAFADAGYDVAVLARGEDGLAGAVADVAAAGRRGLGIACDVADHRAVDAAADQVEERMGPIEVWVNNAMTSIFAPFLDTDPEDFERATAVTYFGFVNGTRAALHRMTRRDRGVLIQVGSALAYRGIPLQAAYCGSKHAMVGFTESVITRAAARPQQGTGLDGAHAGAEHHPVQLGEVELPHHPQPVPPIYQPEVGAAAVVRVAEHPRRNTWVGLPTASRCSATGSSRRCWTATWRGPGTTGSRARRTPAPRSA